MSTDARKPAAAKPTAVEPNELMARNELALLSSSSDAISGRTLSHAGSKNCLTVAARKSSPYIATMPRSLPSASNASGISRTIPPRSRSEARRIRLRLKRSTNTPANSPTKSVGSAETMSTSPTLRTEPVIRNTRMAAARSVNDEPIVETSCASHIRLKSRLRKIANIGRESTGREIADSGAHARVDTLSREQLAFQLQAGLAAAPPAAAVAAQRAVAGDDPVARDDQAQWVAPDGGADRAGGAGAADHSRDLAVAGGRARPDAADRPEHEPVPCGPVVHVDRQVVERAEVARDERLEGAAPGLQVASRRAASRRSVHVDRRFPEAALEAGGELFCGRQLLDGDEAAIGRGEAERPPRSGECRGHHGRANHPARG